MVLHFSQHILDGDVNDLPDVNDRRKRSNSDFDQPPGHHLFFLVLFVLWLRLLNFLCRSILILEILYFFKSQPITDIMWIWCCTWLPVVESAECNMRSRGKTHSRARILCHRPDTTEFMLPNLLKKLNITKQFLGITLSWWQIRSIRLAMSNPLSVGSLILLFFIAVWAWCNRRKSGSSFEISTPRNRHKVAKINS